MSKVICVCNQKGGTGKSTTVCNLGIGLARAGKRVLLIDGDSQGSLTASLGYKDPDSMDVTLATIMEKIINDEEIASGEGILVHPERIHLMPANIELATLEVSMVNIIGREKIMNHYIQLVQDHYDYIIIDCNPSLGMITINALACATSTLIPVQSSYLPIKGLQQLIKTIGIVRRKLNKDLQIEGILLTMVDNRNSFSKDICEMVRMTYGDKVRVFKENIPRSVRAEETSAEGVSIFVHDRKGKVAKAYEALVEEVLANE